MTEPAPTAAGPPGAPTVARVVVVGSGFAGLHTCRALERRLPAGRAQISLVSPTDYLLYSPLLPEVAAGVMDPRHVAVPVAQALSRTVPVLGSALDADLARHQVSVQLADGSTRDVGYDRLVLAPGSVTRQFPIPGIDEHAHGFKSLAEALYLRDHVLAQLELADTAGPAERAARCTVVVVGAGYAGTEFIAQMQHFIAKILPRYRNLTPGDMRWLLCDTAPAVLPELGADLGRKALDVLRGRGIEVHLKDSLTQIRADSVTMTDGSHIPTHTVVWTAGVSASPLIGSLAQRHNLAVDKGRLRVETTLAVPGHPDVWALGDAAAVPDSTHPGSICPPTAQHAQRQAKRAAGNVAATLGVGSPRPYRHHDLGLVVDLAGRDAVARPLKAPLAGLPAKTVTRSYHLLAIPSGNNRTRVALDWLCDAVLARSAAQLGYIPAAAATLPAEHPDLHPRQAVSTATITTPAGTPAPAASGSGDPGGATPPRSAAAS